MKLAEVAVDGTAPVETGIAELDRVLAGGLLPGSVTLLAGEPGIGKSTLVLQALASASRRGLRSLLVAAEESAGQVRSRAERLGALPEECYLLATGELGAALEAAERVSPGLLVVDSVQGLAHPEVGSAAGSPNQARECAQAIAAYAKRTATATVLVGHVTKDGALAGPRALEHLVDTVLSFEGDRHHALRTLSTMKHRFGPAGELGLFEMGESGLRSLDDPSSLLLADRRPGAPGTVAVPAVEGRRPVLVEVQALVTPSRSPVPRRVVQGASPARVALLLAVLEKCCGAPLGGADVFVSTVGGIRVTEPACDLALALSIASSLAGTALPPDTVAFGEIGLTGETRQVPRADRRLLEAARLGFEQALAPMATPEGPRGMRLERVRSLLEALELVSLGRGALSGGPGAWAPPKSWHNC